MIDKKDYDINYEEATKELIEAFNILLKYKVTIGGCGCCDSPWVEIAKSEYYTSNQAKENGYKDFIFGPNAGAFTPGEVVVENYVRTLLSKE